ncbi:carbohydrate ABC transporter permease [Clostridium beijerinckii]|uniref:Fructooligosaccharide transport system permease protein n=1 Tax=Clostridium beijerinckii TaxID=1520 RepID=A0AAX0B9V9_CLOBE|nr:carbohydrate ABC transporter permease [Clostridium beijerinckii]MBE6087506.1 carbohydrate ABC transporter permease [Clostridium beijerinckii]NRT79813.1 fructooligosaccharide transport system permease protein [Clostridium beijerinckii]NRT91916.1 fructooligosaccharide transport system permease protein [Clostridium beijerinckii]NYC71442.1 fructooligosaccharide transport system permease protein [Clostridium beijerinckii]OOM46882.1 lactose transport system permease protein LacG [Clostridium beij
MRKQNNKFIQYIVLILLAVFFMFPLIWMIVSSFKNDSQIFSDISSIKAFVLPAFSSNYFYNYSDCLKQLPILKSMINSFFYIGVIIIFSLIVNSLAGYGFARLDFPGKNILFTILLSLMIIPAQTVMLPLFSIVYKLGWINSYLGLIVPAIANPFYIFLFRQTFLGLPKEIEEAAKLDGANQYTIFVKLIMPLAKPIYATVAIMIFVATWNDFVWPVMVISDPSKQTIQMALSSLFSIQPVNYGRVMAGLTFVTIPVLIIFLTMQKYYVQGIVGSGSKN